MRVEEFHEEILDEINAGLLGGSLTHQGKVQGWEVARAYPVRQAGALSA